jgi:hypothetical protein
MKKVFLILSALFSFYATEIKAQSLCTACPTDNPIAKYYAATGDYGYWTDEVKWDKVLDMSQFPDGTNNFEKFKNARDFLYNTHGGGVLYYPAGTYNFDIPDGPNDEGLMLKKGVVIRGEEPATDNTAISTHDIQNMAATDHGLNSLGTKFVFTTKTLGGGEVNKAWNVVGAKKGPNEQHLGKVSLVGIAWVEIQHGYIYFGMDNLRWSSTWNTGKGYISGPSKMVNGWGDRIPDGTFPIDPSVALSNGNGIDTALMGEKRFVFGCKLINCGTPNYMVNKSGSLNYIGDPYPFAWTGKIGVQGRHVFIANNVVAKPTASFQPFPWTSKGGSAPNGQTIATRYDYGYGIGIEVNKSIGANFGNRSFKTGNQDPVYYSEDVVIQDNVIYNHGDKCIEASGKWLVVKNNVMPRDFLRHNDDPYGIGTVNYGVNWSNGKAWNGESVDDMLSRAMDMAGWNMWFSNNYYRRTGTSYANDGEGILFQRHTGVEVYSLAETFNHGCGAICGGDNGYIAPYDMHVIGMLQMKNFQQGATGVLNGNANWIEDISAAAEINYKFDSSATTTPSSAGSNVKDFYSSCNNTLSPTDTVLDFSVIQDAANYQTLISYKDNSPNEIGYKIQKRLAATSNPWIDIAYRPRQETNLPNTMDEISVAFGYPADADMRSACFPSAMKISDMNPSMWIDYKGNPGNAFEYRIVTLGCKSTGEILEETGGVILGNGNVATAPKKGIQVSILPNPSSGNTRIDFTLPQGQNGRVDILDITGKNLFSFAEDVSGTNVLLKAGSLNPGIYLVKVSSGNGSSRTERLVVK